MLLGRTDTREMTWAFLVRTLPHRTRVVVEPAIPKRVIERWLAPGFNAPPHSGYAGPAAARFIRSRDPALIDLYRATGHCTIVSFSSVRRRIESQPQPKADAYYRRLEAESTVIFHGNPYRAGVRRPPFDFDQTLWLHYPPVFERPGPEAIVYRLDDCRPAQAPPPITAIARAARTPGKSRPHRSHHKPRQRTQRRDTLRPTPPRARSIQRELTDRLAVEQIKDEDETHKLREPVLITVASHAIITDATIAFGAKRARSRPPRT